MGSNEPVRNECEVVYEVFHIQLHSLTCSIYNNTFHTLFVFFFESVLAPKMDKKNAPDLVRCNEIKQG